MNPAESLRGIIFGRNEDNGPDINSGGLSVTSEINPIEPGADRHILIERWRNLPAKTDAYGFYGDGSRKLTLRIGGEQVMDTFEKPWCEKTVGAMFYELEKGPVTVVERGFGLGIMSELINNRMRSIGGEHIIIELNADVAKNAKRWADSRNREPMKMLHAPNLTVRVIEGDADEVLSQFPENSIDLLFSDTHQLQPSELGINDLLQPQMLSSKIKSDGRFTFCAFNRENQFGVLEDRQIELLNEGFGKLFQDHVEVNPPEHCDYLKGGSRRILPVVVAYQKESQVRPSSLPFFQ